MAVNQYILKTAVKELSLPDYTAMLQRIQSIYLLLASLAIFALFLFPLAQAVYVNGSPLSLMVTGVYQDVNGARVHTEFFVALTIATAIIAFCL